MKKIYAIIAAAVAASGMASAQLPSVSFNKADLVPLTGFTWSEAPVSNHQVKSVTSDIKGISVNKVASRADEFEAIYGDYVFTFYDEESPFTSRTVTTNIAPAGEGEVTVSQFFYSDAEDMTAALGYEDIEYSDGTTETMLLLTLYGYGSEKRTPFLMMADEEGGTPEPWYLCLVDFSAKKLYTNDLEFAVFPESGEMPFVWSSNYGLGFANEAGQGYLWVQAPALYKKNAEMTAMFYAGSDGYEELTVPVWTYLIDGNYTDTGDPYKAVFAAGWGLCGDMFHFMVEDLGEDQYVAAAYEQVGWAPEDGDAYFCDLVFDDQGNPDFYWYIDGQEQIWMVANVGVDGEGNTVFSQDGDWCLFNPDQGIVTTWKEGTTVFDYYIGVGNNGGGTEGVEAIESNDNAPAEYYNLQGVKVANPTPGQLYIVKQGSKVSKVIR